MSISKRIQLVGQAILNGSAASHSSVENLNEKDMKAASSWGPAMRV